MLHERQVDRILDRHPPGALLRVVRARHHRLQLGGQPLDLDRRREHERKALRRVEDVVVEVVREFRECGLDLVEARLPCALKRHARELRPPDRLLQDAAAGRRVRRQPGKERLRKVVETAGLPHAQGERHDVALVFFLDLPPRLGVADALQVRDDAPRLPEGTLRVVERHDVAFPRRRGGRLQFVHPRARGGQKLRQRLVGRRRRQIREIGECPDGEKRILHRASSSSRTFRGTSAKSLGSIE